MRFCYDPADGDMTLLDGDGEEVDWGDACVPMEFIFEVIMEQAESLCMDSEEDRVRLIAMLAKHAEYNEDVGDLDTDPYDDYHDLPDASDDVEHLTDGEWRVKDIDEDI